MRSAEIGRETRETKIYVKLEIDGKGEGRIDCPLGFFTHMLETFARHGLFDIEVKASGDIHVDEHHLVEDTGIVLGQCFAKALGDKRGVRRNGSCLFPMDETLARAAVDLSGRPYLAFDAGELDDNDTHDTTEDFWRAFVCEARIACHLDIIRGRSKHHKIEALFKAAARALRDACEIDPRAGTAIPSTKGVLA